MAAESEYYRAGRAALRVMENRAVVPREPRDRFELQGAFQLLAALVEGYRPEQANTDPR